MNQAESLEFPLDVDEDWPPVSIECMPVRRTASGHEVLVAPLFVKGLSVGDVIDATREGARVLAWRHVSRSKNTTVWLLVVKKEATGGLPNVLAGLRDAGCGTVEAGSLGAYSINVPDVVSITVVDALLARLDPASIAVAFPSMRHAEADEQIEE
ncbi:MAG: DUF4265 domain-containing protein [Myxococcales bacterium]|nr:DUF4265 domain-containing protein [Myxococcales bacterium]